MHHSAFRKSKPLNVKNEQYREISPVNITEQTVNLLNNGLTENFLLTFLYIKRPSENRNPSTVIATEKTDENFQ